MSNVMDRIRQAAAKAAAGPLADARERPDFPRVAAQSPFQPDAGIEDYIERFRTELETLSTKVYGPLDPAGAADKVVELLLAAGQGDAEPASHPLLSGEASPAPIQVLSWSLDEVACPELGERLSQAGIQLVPGEVPNNEHHQSTLERLAALEAGLSGAVAGLADTGSIVVASGRGRARVASLLPPVHVAILRVDRLYPTMHDWLKAGGARLVGSTTNVVVITGSSRTSDIEMQLTLGMHGPKEMHVVLLK